MNKRFIIIHIIRVLSTLFLANGCKNGPTTISYGDPLISAELRKFDKVKAPIAYVEVDGTELLPIVAINNDTLELGACNPTSEHMWESYFRCEVSTDPDNEYELIVSHKGGEARATITLPGDFEIISPLEDDTLYQGENLTVNWSLSERAERYELHIRLSYYYGDTANPNHSSFRLDTILSETEAGITIPEEKIFLPDIDSIQEGYGYVDIQSENGPQIGMSAEGNISGEGSGYFNAYIHSNVYFYIEDTSN
jgi:hypothetical protein